MSCEPHRDELILLLDPELAEDPERELSAAALETIRDHVQGCASCQDELLRLTLALEAAVEEPAPAGAHLAASAGAVSSESCSGGSSLASEEPYPPRPTGRFQRSARAAALAAELPRRRRRAAHEEVIYKLGRYEILAEIGRGGMGIVYHARSETGQEVALKVCLGLPARRQRQRREAFAEVRQALDASQSPRLAAALEVFFCEDSGGDPLWVEVLPYFQGPSLQDLLEGGRCDPAEATQIVTEVARAVREAHQAGLLLSDLKPRDVFLEAEGVRVLVPDRPYSSEGHLTASGAMIGTPYYLSPEQGQGLASDERSDLFALGAIYHHLLTGAPPNRNAQTLAELLRDRIEGNLPEPTLPELSLDHKKVLARLMAANPEQRYADAEAALSDLLLLSEDLPIERQDPSWTQLVRRDPPLFENRASAVTLMGLVAALAALIALAYLLLG